MPLDNRPRRCGAGSWAGTTTWRKSPTSDGVDLMGTIRRIECRRERRPGRAHGRDGHATAGRVFMAGTATARCGAHGRDGHATVRDAAHGRDGHATGRLGSWPGTATLRSLAFFVADVGRQCVGAGCLKNSVDAAWKADGPFTLGPANPADFVADLHEWARQECAPCRPIPVLKPSMCCGAQLHPGIGLDPVQPIDVGCQVGDVQRGVFQLPERPVGSRAEPILTPSKKNPVQRLVDCGAFISRGDFAIRRSWSGRCRVRRRRTIAHGTADEWRGCSALPLSIFACELPLPDRRCGGLPALPGIPFASAKRVATEACEEPLISAIELVGRCQLGRESRDPHAGDLPRPPVLGMGSAGLEGLPEIPLARKRLCQPCLGGLGLRGVVLRFRRNDDSSRLRGKTRFNSLERALDFLELPNRCHPVLIGQSPDWRAVQRVGIGGELGDGEAGWSQCQRDHVRKMACVHGGECEFDARAGQRRVCPGASTATGGRLFT